MPAKPKLWFSIVEAKMKLAGLKVEDPTHQESMFALVQSSIKGRLPSKVVFHKRSSSTPELPQSCPRSESSKMSLVV